MRSALFILLAAAAGLESQQRPEPGTAFILGQVVDAESGRGVSGAVVTIGAPPTLPPSLGELVELGTPPAATGRRVLTGADGRFLFRELTQGRYAISVTAPGYVPGNFGQGRPGGPGQTLELDNGQKLGSAIVRMW